VRKEVKFECIQKFKRIYPIKDMCKYFNISRSGYYAFVKRKYKPNPDKMLMDLIKECHSIRFQNTYGCRRVALWICREKGIYYNYKTVWRVMHKYGLLSKIRRKRYRQYTDKIYKYPNIINRDFEAESKNKKWVTDVSHIPTKEGTLYLSVIRDLFDNSIVSYKTSTSPSNKLVFDTVLNALDIENPNDLLLHSDGGYQYASQGYHDIAKTNGITLYMSRVGNPYDNSPAENFFSIIKTECLRLEKTNSFSYAISLIDEFINFYDFERIQTKTKQTPFEKRCLSV
jgi:Transposase and inactivated derivatives